MSKFKLGDKVICKPEFAERYKIPGTGIPGTVVDLPRTNDFKDYISINLDSFSQNQRWFVNSKHFQLFDGNIPYMENDLVEIVSSDYKSIQIGDIKVVKRLGPKNSVIVYNKVGSKPLLFYPNEVKLFKRIFV